MGDWLETGIAVATAAAAARGVQTGWPNDRADFFKRRRPALVAAADI